MFNYDYLCLNFFLGLSPWICTSIGIFALSLDISSLRDDNECLRDCISGIISSASEASAAALLGSVCGCLDQ